MWEPGSKTNTHILGVKRKTPLKGWVVIGFYDSDQELLKAFKRYHLQTGIITYVADACNINGQVIDCILPRSYACID